MGMCGYYIALDSKTLEQIKNNELDLFDFMYGGERYDKENFLDIDKTWHALFYTLSEMSVEDENLSHAVPLNDTDELNPDIPTFFLDASIVPHISESVNKITREKMLENYNFADMLESDIYPLVAGEEAELFFEYMYDEHFVEIQKFFSKAANENKAIIFCIV